MSASPLQDLRALRTLGFLVSILTAPLYLAIITWHQGVLPLSVLLSVAASRQEIPLSPLAEALLLLLCFDLLREAGARTPSSIGQTLSVVGGLVVGQAAVEAHLVSSFMLIIIALSGVTALIVPKLKGPVVIWLTLLLLLSAALGIYGWTFGLFALALRLCGLSSFGIPYLASLPCPGSAARGQSFRPPYNYMQKFGVFWRERGDSCEKTTAAAARHPAALRRCRNREPRKAGYFPRLLDGGNGGWQMRPR